MNPAQLNPAVETLVQTPEGSTQSAIADPAALLEMLRDIQLPAAVSWWPPAPGWWGMLGVVLFAWLAWRYEWFARWRPWWQTRSCTQAPFATALETLANARVAFTADGDTGALVVALSVLLRRVAMESASRDEVAGLTGDRWLEWLDEQVSGRAFSSDLGRVFADAPYRAPADIAAEVDGDALLQVCEKWVLAVSRSASTGSAA